MLSRLLSIIYLAKQKIDRILLQGFIKSKLSKGSPMPIIKSKVFWNATNVKIGKNVTLYPGVYLWGRNIEIGDNVNIGMNTVIFAKKGVTIGNNTNIAGQCYIIDTNHGTKAGRLIREQEDDVAENGIFIGNDVWIAAQCVILKGAKINDGAVIGAQSLVNCEIPANAIAVGTPAKVIGYRK